MSPALSLCHHSASSDLLQGAQGAGTPYIFRVASVCMPRAVERMPRLYMLCRYAYRSRKLQQARLLPQRSCQQQLPLPWFSALCLTSANDAIFSAHRPFALRCFRNSGTSMPPCEGCRNCLDGLHHPAPSCLVFQALRTRPQCRVVDPSRLTLLVTHKRN